MASRPPTELPLEMPENPAPGVDTPDGPPAPDDPVPDAGTAPWVEGP